jgi:tetratricopeptide (TPR) repeat protein
VVKARIHRLRQIAPLLTAALLLGGCALFPIDKQARVRDPGPEVRPLAPPEYDLLVAQDHQARGDLEKSLAAFERALEKDPDSAYIHRKLAVGLIRSTRRIARARSAGVGTRPGRSADPRLSGPAVSDAAQRRGR